MAGISWLHLSDFHFDHTYYDETELLLKVLLEDITECIVDENIELDFIFITGDRAIESPCKGIGRQSRLVLDNIGIVFKASEAYTWFKETYNIKKLTDMQRRKAWIEYAIRLVKEKAEKLMIASQSKKTRLEQLYAHLTNARGKFGQKVLQQ